MIAAEAIDRGDQLEAGEAVAFGLERRDQHVHRFLDRDACERRRNVAADPRILVAILEKVTERRDDRGARPQLQLHLHVRTH